MTRGVGLERLLYVMGANFGDIDTDGWLDVYLGTGAPAYESLMPNRMFRNAEGRRFLDVNSAGGLGHLQKGHAISFGDLDGDGDKTGSGVSAKAAPDPSPSPCKASP